jgi:hypothetical protein
MAKHKVEIGFDASEKALEMFDCVENLEKLFGFEFSCGDGLFMSDIESDDAMLEKYDGKVDWSLLRKDRKLIQTSTIYLRCDYDDEFQENGRPEFTNCKLMRYR